MFKRRDLEDKIDKLAIGQLRIARIIFNVANTARKEHEESVAEKLRKAAERE